jgi:hypothetical protein
MSISVYLEMTVNTILRKSTHTTTIILLSSSEGTIVLSREVQWLNQRRGHYPYAGKYIPQA